MALRLRKDRDPSSGSSSKIKVLKTECEPGRAMPRNAGNRSLVNLEVEDLRLDLDDLSSISRLLAEVSG